MPIYTSPVVWNTIVATIAKTSVTFCIVRIVCRNALGLIIHPTTTDSRTIGCATICATYSVVLPTLYSIASNKPVVCRNGGFLSNGFALSSSAQRLVAVCVSPFRAGPVALLTVLFHNTVVCRNGFRSTMLAHNSFMNRRVLQLDTTIVTFVALVLTLVCGNFVEPIELGRGISSRLAHHHNPPRVSHVLLYVSAPFAHYSRGSTSLGSSGRGLGSNSSAKHGSHHQIVLDATSGLVSLLCLRSRVACAFSKGLIRNLSFDRPGFLPWGSHLRLCVEITLGFPTTRAAVENSQLFDRPEFPGISWMCSVA